MTGQGAPCLAAIPAPEQSVLLKRKLQYQCILLKKRTLERQKSEEQAVHQVLVNRGFLESKPWAILGVWSAVVVKKLNRHILSLPKKKKKSNQLPYETEEMTHLLLSTSGYTKFLS